SSSPTRCSAPPSSSARRCSTSTSRRGWGRRARSGARSASPRRSRRSKLSATRPHQEDRAVPLYLMLTTLTEKGVQTLNSNPGRLREVNRDIEELGARIVHQWASIGEYDFVNIVEAPDDVTLAKLSVVLGARGSSRIESLPLIEVDDVLAALEA